MVDFFTKFELQRYRTKDGNLIQRMIDCRQKDLRVVQFYPRIRPNPDNESFWKYCRQQLLKYSIYRNREEVFGNIEKEEDYILKWRKFKFENKDT